MNNAEQVDATLSLLAVYVGHALPDGEATRSLVLTEEGLNSLAMASVIVELEERLEREFDFEAFAGIQTVQDLLRAIGLAA